MKIVNILNYGKVVQSYRSNKSVRLIVGMLDPYSHSYDSVNEVLNCHMTKEKHSLPDLLTLNVGVTDRITPTP